MWREYVAYHVAASLIVGRSNSNGALEKARTSNILSSGAYKSMAYGPKSGAIGRILYMRGHKKERAKARSS